MNKLILLKGMNAIVISLNNENAYYNNWIQVFPDLPCEEDFLEIVKSEESFKEIVLLFLSIMKKYAKDGIYLDEELYTLGDELEDE